MSGEPPPKSHKGVACAHGHKVLLARTVTKVLLARTVTKVLLARTVGHRVSASTAVSQEFGGCDTGLSQHLSVNWWRVAQRSRPKQIGADFMDRCLAGFFCRSKPSGDPIADLARPPGLLTAGAHGDHQ